MDTPGYTTLTRQTGLMREMQMVANNIANSATTGYRRQGLVFSEHISALEPGEASLSMANGNVNITSQMQGPLTQTGGTFDFAIEGDGFFLIETADGEQLTRAGVFTPNAESELVTSDGYRLLDNGGAPIFVPPDARTVSLAADGTLSADGRAVAQVGVYLPTNGNDLAHQEGTRFSVTEGVEPYEGAIILQGFVENSNVNAVTEIARMIEVQHAYELGQKFLEKEDERIRSVLQTLGK